LGFTHRQARQSPVRGDFRADESGGTRRIKSHNRIREPVLVEDEKLAKMLDSALAETDAMAMMKRLTVAGLENHKIPAENEDKEPEAMAPDIDDTPAARFINKTLLDAINQKASDIHFESYEKLYRVRFCLDGILQVIAIPPPT
jgi:type IV pilus assembly protein PilB